MKGEQYVMEKTVIVRGKPPDAKFLINETKAIFLKGECVKLRENVNVLGQMGVEAYLHLCACFS